MKVRVVRSLAAAVLAISVLSAPAYVSAQDEAKPATFDVTKFIGADGKLTQGDVPLGTISFVGTAPGKKHDGGFAKWRFTKVDIPGGDLAKGIIELEIDIASVHSDAGKLTNHLQQPDYFSAAEFPKAKLAIKNAKPGEKDSSGAQLYEADGELTIRGVAAPLTVTFSVVEEKPLKVKGTATVNRDSFGVGPKSNPEAPRTPNADVAIVFETFVPEKIEAPKAVAEIEKKVDDAAAKVGAALDAALPTPRKSH